MALKCLKPFSWAHQGVRVRQYEPGDILEDDAELAPLALERGWAATASAPPADAEVASDAAAPARPDLSKMDLVALLKLAREWEVEVPEGAKRRAVLKLLERAERVRAAGQE